MHRVPLEPLEFDIFESPYGRPPDPSSPKTPQQQKRNSKNPNSVDGSDIFGNPLTIYRGLSGRTRKKSEKSLRGPPAPGDFFQTFSGFRARKARETSVNGQRVPNGSDIFYFFLFRGGGKGGGVRKGGQGGPVLMKKIEGGGGVFPRRCGRGKACRGNVCGEGGGS